MANGNRPPSWWARNDFRFLRFVFALILFAAVTIPLARNGMTLIDRKFDSLTAVTKTVTITTPITSGNRDAAPAGESDKVNKGEGQYPVKTEKTEDSTAPQVWAYLAQLIAWAAMLGMSLWALVALCREE